MYLLKEAFRAATRIYCTILRNRGATVMNKAGMKEFIELVYDVYESSEELIRLAKKPEDFKNKHGNK